MDEMMEKERTRAVQDMQKKREQDWAHKQNYSASILEQIRDNEKQRLKEIEKLQRVIIIREYFSAMKQLSISISVNTNAVYVK